MREPFAGPCGDGESLFSSQPDYSTSMHVVEATLTSDDLSQWEGLPYETSRTGYTTLDSHTLSLWMSIKNFPENCTYRVRYLRPNSSVRYDSGVKPFRTAGNPFYRSSTWWLRNTINFDMAGDWKIEVTLNGEQTFRAPLTVLSLSAPTNRPPYPIEVQFMDDQLEPDTVIGAKIANWSVIDDPDYDILQYNYVWKRDG